jgi:hypothetical protein
MNAIASFRKCTLSNTELLDKVDNQTDRIFKKQKVPTRHIPAEPNEDYDLLVGELILRFDSKEHWIDAEKETPQLIDKENYSPNVLAVCKGQLSVMCYCYIDGEDGGFVWASCNGNIDGDAEFDDNYEVTHWMYLPKIPKEIKQ